MVLHVQNVLAGGWLLTRSVSPTLHRIKETACILGAWYTSWAAANVWRGWPLRDH